MKICYPLFDFPILKGTNVDGIINYNDFILVWSKDSYPMGTDPCFIKQFNRIETVLVKEINIISEKDMGNNKLPYKPVFLENSYYLNNNIKNFPQRKITNILIKK